MFIIIHFFIQIQKVYCLIYIIIADLHNILSLYFTAFTVKNIFKICYHSIFSFVKSTL